MDRIVDIDAFEPIGALAERVVGGLGAAPSFVPDFFERYFDRYVEEPMSGCWLWIASQTTAGYGNFTYENATYYAHRSSFEAVHGEGSSVGFMVRHRCDLPCCMNPDHLLRGMAVDNSADAWRRGRMNPARGERHPRAVLTEADVLRARHLAASGMPLCDIARSFPDATRNAIEEAVTGATWTHLSGAVASDLITKAEVEPPHGRGDNSPRAILTEAQVAEIKRRLRAGETGRSLAIEFGVSFPTISSIKVGRNWSHVA